jgi:hypothetical protein
MKVVSKILTQPDQEVLAPDNTRREKCLSIRACEMGRLIAIAHG